MRLRLSISTLLLTLFALGAPAWAAKVKVCHVPPGNPANFHTITIDDSAVQAHLAHGDLLGDCSAHCSQLCDDGDACTIDACDSSGHCAATHPPVNCDDGNACTIDTCDSKLGCMTTSKTCVDGNLCTVDTCDPLTGSCAFPPVACPAGQTCNPGNGNCETTDFCTPNPCAHGACEDLPNGYLCLCDPGWSGTNCNINFCTGKPDLTPCVYPSAPCPGYCYSQVCNPPVYCE